MCEWNHEILQCSQQLFYKAWQISLDYLVEPIELQAKQPKSKNKQQVSPAKKETVM